MYDMRAARYPLVYFVSLKSKQFPIPLLLQLPQTMRTSCSSAKGIYMITREGKKGSGGAT